MGNLIAVVCDVYEQQLPFSKTTSKDPVSNVIFRASMTKYLLLDWCCRTASTCFLPLRSLAQLLDRLFFCLSNIISIAGSLMSMLTIDRLSAVVSSRILSASRELPQPIYLTLSGAAKRAQRTNENFTNKTKTYAPNKKRGQKTNKKKYLQYFVPRAKMSHYQWQCIVRGKVPGIKERNQHPRKPAHAARAVRYHS
jgi:hypothetical protein